MADVAVETPVAQALPHRKQMSSIPNIDSLEGISTDGTDEYSTLKKLQRHLECVPCEGLFATANRHLGTSSCRRNISRMNRGPQLYPEHLDISVLTRCRSLKRELVRAQEEIKRIQSVPLVIGQFMEAIDQK
jgi:26S proteasome regulatory subunit T3